MQYNPRILLSVLTLSCLNILSYISASKNGHKQGSRVDSELFQVIVHKKLEVLNHLSLVFIILKHKS